MRHELWPHRVCTADGASGHRRFTAGGPQSCKPLRQELLPLRPESGHSLRPAQLTYRENLRDIETCLGAVGGSLCACFGPRFCGINDPQPMWIQSFRPPVASRVSTNKRSKSNVVPVLDEEVEQATAHASLSRWLPDMSQAVSDGIQDPLAHSTALTCQSLTLLTQRRPMVRRLAGIGLR